ncbi:MAG: hypothetical protein P8L68_18725 [Paracoccaceae bacterium]|nr:hypothetical protein [Paracoccaceae bacterium]MDG2260511.1 hypothetical protein [Paracoccaceae bacterium]
MSYHVSSRRFFGGLFALDTILIILSAAWGFAFLKELIAIRPDFWNIDRDWSAGEVLNYIKWLILAFVFLSAYLRNKAVMMLSLFLVVLILLADDSLQLHETLGPNVVHAIGLQHTLGEKAYTFGSMVIWGGLGVVVLAITLFGWRTATVELRRQLYPVFAFFFAIIFCAVGIDAIHELFDFPKVIKGLLGILEDGGEMLFLTAMTRHVWIKFRST